MLCDFLCHPCAPRARLACPSCESEKQSPEPVATRLRCHLGSGLRASAVDDAIFRVQRSGLSEHEVFFILEEYGSFREPDRFSEPKRPSSELAKACRVEWPKGQNC